MSTEIQDFEKYLSNNQLSSYYSKQLVQSLNDELRSDLATILRDLVSHYSVIPRVNGVLQKSDNFEDHLRISMDLLPSAFFVASNRFYRESIHYRGAKLLQIAGISAHLTKDPDDTDCIDLFVGDIDPDDSMKALNAKIGDASASASYFPRIVYEDFVEIRKQYKNLVVTKDPHDLIDVIFSFQGLMQIYLKYYFEILTAAPSDTSAIHINKLFNILFATLKYQEVKYWNHYANSRQLQAQLFHIIKMDAASQRHPVLRKHIFDSLRQYNPIIKDARSRFSEPEIRRIQMDQIRMMLSMSIPRIAVLLETVFLTKGRSHLVYLLTQIIKSANQKLLNLKEYAQKAELNKDVVQMIEYFVDKVSAAQQRSNVSSSQSSKMGTVIQTAESLRRLQAQKSLKQRQRTYTLTYDQVSNFIKRKMSRMYQRVQQEGALTSANISEYLARFTDTAQPLLTLKSGENSKQAITKFQVSADAIIKDIVQKGHLTADQSKQFELFVHSKTNQLAQTASEAKRAELIEQIGIALTDASVKSDNLRREKKAAEPRVVTANITLNQKQIPDFLENNLQNFYIKVKKDGALTQRKVDDFVQHFSQVANKVVVSIPADKKESEVNKFIVTTEHIFKEINKEGYLPEESASKIKKTLHAIYPKVRSANEETRAKLVEQIGLELAAASAEVKQRKAQVLSPESKETRVDSQYTKFPKALRQDEVPGFLENYLKKLYARSRKDGALTQDQVSSYLQQFASTARQIIFHIPPEKRGEAINDFKASTDNILVNMTNGSHLNKNEVQEIRLEIHGRMRHLETNDQRERVEIVDQIGLILADTYDKVEDDPESSAIDVEFLKREIIPYGLDETAKLVSSNSFFSFPFGERKGPAEDERYNYHFKYLEMIVQKSKFKKEHFQKISEAAEALPKIKYRKYFNIFPNDEFEETTFMAVLDLWQNRALDSLIVK